MWSVAVERVPIDGWCNFEILCATAVHTELPSREGSEADCPGRSCISLVRVQGCSAVAYHL